MSSLIPSLPPAAEIIARYGAYLAARDLAAMAAQRTPDCVVDLVCRDAYGQAASELTPEEFYRSLFESFLQLDFETTRTLAATDAVFTEWTLRGSTSGALKQPLFTGTGESIHPGRAVRIRGATLYDLVAGLIRREVIYFDYLTLVVELGSKA